MRSLTLFRFLWGRGAGLAALQRGLALYLTIGIVSVIIFAGQGLDAKTVVQMAGASVLRMLLLAAWTISSLPVAKAILATPETGFLRALPVATWQIAVALGSMLAVAELPWFILWARGGGMLHGAGAVAVAMSVHAFAVARSRRRVAMALFAATLAAFAVPQPTVWLLVASACLAHAIPEAWRRAPEIPPSRGAAIGHGPPAFALLGAYAIGLVRSQRAALVRALILVVVGMGWACLAVANNEVWQQDGALRSSIMLGIWIPLGVFVSATLAGPLLRAEEQARWVLDTCAVERRTRRLAIMGLLAIAGAFLGLLAGASVGVGFGLAWPARLALGVRFALYQLALSVVTETCARYALREGGHDSARLIVTLLGVVVVAEGVSWALG